MIRYGIKLYLLAASLFVNTIITHAKGQDNVTVTHPGPCKPGEGREEGIIPLDIVDPIMGSETACINGFADVYPCSNTVLKSFVPSSTLNIGASTATNDNWGWVSGDGREIALVGLRSGTSFVDITDPVNPIVIGKLPTVSGGSIWRDIKTYQNHAFIVSEESGHGMQVFDLTQLTSGLQNTIFSATARYTSFGNAHNIFINEDSGFAYAVGSNSCNGGLHMINISTPTNPVSAGCYSTRGYTHDVQCVNYDGPDTDYANREVCFASNEDTVDIIDVTDKNNPTLISIFSYGGARYTHQGWLSEDHKFFFFDDELDEYNGITSKTLTFVADITDLDNPTMKKIYQAATGAIDHNQYVKGTLLYQANYRAGLRIIDVADIQNGVMQEIAYFDTYPQDDGNQFTSAWSTYPYFDSGNILITDYEKGLFVVSMNSSGTSAPTSSASPTVSRPPSAMPNTQPSALPSMSPTEFCSGADADAAHMKLELKTDNYGGETSWRVTDESGAIVRSGAGYQNNRDFTINECLSSGCYVFTILDSWGDGICCGYGQGLYSLFVDGELIKSGGDFGQSEATSFCAIPSSSPTVELSSAPSSSPSSVPTAMSSSAPSSSPSSAPSSLSSSAPSSLPSSSPSGSPSTIPSILVSSAPTMKSSSLPSSSPSSKIKVPSASPSQMPSVVNEPPIESPSQSPSGSQGEVSGPSMSPTIDDGNPDDELLVVFIQMLIEFLEMFLATMTRGFGKFFG